MADTVETEAPPPGVPNHLFTSAKAAEAARKRWANRPAQPAAAAASRRRAGRRRKLLQGPQPREMSVGRPAATVQSADPTEDIENSTETGKAWRRLLKDRIKNRRGLTVPAEAMTKHPEGDFCWARNDPDCVSKYQSDYGYEIVRLDAPLQGQQDTTVRHRDSILMVRSQEMRAIHDEARAEILAERYGDAEGYTQQAEREAMQAALSQGYKPRDVRGLFFEERINDAGEAADRRAADAARRTIKGATGRGSRYVPGGIPT